VRGAQRGRKVFNLAAAILLVTATLGCSQASYEATDGQNYLRCDNISEAIGKYQRKFHKWPASPKVLFENNLIDKSTCFKCDQIGIDFQIQEGSGGGFIFVTVTTRRSMRTAQHFITDGVECALDGRPSILAKANVAK
jgi:hypothetical protein